MKQLIQLVSEQDGIFVEVRNDNGSITVDGFGNQDVKHIVAILEAAANGLPKVLRNTAKYIKETSEKDN